MASKKSIKENKKLYIDDNGYFKVSLDTFLYNAGIVGFIQVLEEAEASKGKNKEEVKNYIKDYYYEGQDLYVSKKFLLKFDFAKHYLKSIYNKFHEKSILYKLINSSDKITLENINKEYGFLFKRKTLITISNTLKDNKFISLVEKFNNEKKEREKIFKDIVKYLNKNEKLRYYLFLGDIFMNKLSLIFSNIYFLKYLSNSKQHYIVKDLDFYKNIDNEFTSIKNYISLEEDNKKSYKDTCIICNAKIKKDFDTTFLLEFGVDTGRKRSTFWNYNPDSYICPICYMIYSCAPLGFRDIGNLIFFINQNDSIKTLISMNIAGKIIDEEEYAHYTAYNTIINKDLDEKTEELNSIQVIIRNKNGYSFNTIGHDTLKIIKSIKGELEVISKSYLIIPKDNRFDIYKICLENVLNFRNQWNLIYLLLMNFEKDGEKGYTINYTVKTIFTILKIQIKQNHIFREDINMNDKINLSYIACKSGDEMRRIIIGVNNDRNLLDMEEKEADNKLRGLVYQLINSIHTSNRDLFLSNITRLYAGMNLTIPNIFTRIFERDEDFKEIGYAYVLGLKGAYYNNKEKENKNEQGE
ncbi:Cas8a1 family CRISPR/Cas system-associated protein [uncultured Brachyspira sp.]|jgi:CRISPR-associated protein Cst1|uniref:Cas8a1 family CRISPR/Cas system-associated protein n=1 Tax=uncultured Brachyspira sp. TaxID=221953 RepID=UPI00258973DA|nr:Cas8a1 family CRISPR/Cas system-associated protein [uncultured Brachyspira sp.]